MMLSERGSSERTTSTWSGGSMMEDGVGESYAVQRRCVDPRKGKDEALRAETDRAVLFPPERNCERSGPSRFPCVRTVGDASLTATMSGSARESRWKSG